MKKKILVILVLFVVIFASGGIYFKSRSGAYDVNEEKKVVVNIPSGSGTDSIADILSDAKLIKNKLVFKINVKMSGKASQFKAGEYQFDQSYTNGEIIDDIAAGKIYHSGPKVTVKEGATSIEIIDELVKKNLGTKENYEKLINNPDEFRDKYEFLKDKNIKSLEGFLYPSTYFCTEGESEREVISRMLNKFDEMYKYKIKPEMDKHKDLNFYDVMKMASIIEKEAVVDKDRPLISSVFYNRLAKDMPLQSDATIQYAFKERKKVVTYEDLKIESPLISSVFYNRLAKDMPLQSDATIQYAFKERKKVVTYEDLKIESPYNSYKYKGLPPTPIANPSWKSIEAAINPAETDYLYFVAKTDGGENNYAKTYEEHLKNEKRYKEQREKNK